MKKILVVLIALMALIAFVACDSTPKPTPAPSAGEIPVIPSPGTPIKQVDEEAKEVIATVIEDLIELLNSSKKVSENKDPSLDGSVVISAKENSIEVGEETLSFPAFEATIKEDNGKIALKFNVVAKFNNVYKVVGADLNLITGEAQYIVGGDTLEAKVIDEEWKYYYNGTEVDNYEYYDVLDGLMNSSILKVATLALSDSTIEFRGNPMTLTIDDKVITAKGKVTINADISSLETFGGTINAENLYVSIYDKSSGIEANATCNATITAEAVTLSGSLLSINGNVCIPNLSVYASFSEDAEARFDLKDLDIELNSSHDGSDPLVEGNISLTIGWKELAVSAHMANTYVCNIKSSDGSLGLEYDYEYNELEETEKISFKVNSKESLGIGLKDNRNSVGLVADLIIDIDSDNIESQSSPMDSLVIDPKVAVINGAYYNPEGFVDAVMEAIFNLASED